MHREKKTQNTCNSQIKKEHLSKQLSLVCIIGLSCQGNSNFLLI